MSATQHSRSTDDSGSDFNYESVRDAVQRWPLSMRAALIRDLIDMLVRQTEPPQAKVDTLSEALGLLANDKPAPTDSEVALWLGEHRTEKYG